MLVRRPKYYSKSKTVKSKRKLHPTPIFGFMLRRYNKKLLTKKAKIKLMRKKKRKFKTQRVSFKIWRIWSNIKKLNYRLFSNFISKQQYKVLRPLIKKKYNDKKYYKNIAFLTNLYITSGYNYAILRSRHWLKIPKTYIYNHFIITYVPVNKIKFLSIKKSIILRQFQHQNLRYAKNRLLRKRLRRWTNRYRKIKKHAAYNNVVLRLFSILTGLSLFHIKKMWLIIRRSNLNSWGINQLINHFTIQITLLPHNLLFLLGLISSTMSGLLLLKQGAIICNGQIHTGTTALQPGDILQLQPNALQSNKFMYSVARKYSKIAYLPFIYFDFSLLLIMVLRYPYLYELLFHSFLSTRWVRYYIRGFSVKNKHY